MEAAIHEFLHSYKHSLNDLAVGIGEEPIYPHLGPRDGFGAPAGAPAGAPGAPGLSPAEMMMGVPPSSEDELKESPPAPEPEPEENEEEKEAAAAADTPPGDEEAEEEEEKEAAAAADTPPGDE